jgi:hypothetical protein
LTPWAFAAGFAGASAEVNLKLLRFSSGQESTLGALSVDGKFVCFVLEDQHQAVKVASETRIPKGTYQLRLRGWGGFHNRYLAKFDFHEGMIEIVGVPGFTDILLHCGNTDNNTAGCLLVGDGVHENVSTRGYLSSSESAYRRVYPSIANAVKNGGAQITIEECG